MSVLAKWGTLFCKEQYHCNIKAPKRLRGTRDSSPTYDVCGSFAPLACDGYKRWNFTSHGSKVTLRTKMRQKADTFSMVNRSTFSLQASVEIPVLKVKNAVSHRSSGSRNVNQSDHPPFQPEARNNKRQLEALDAYFGKLQHDMAGQTSPCISASRSGAVPKRAGHKHEDPSFQSQLELDDTSEYYNSKMRLDSLEDYFEKLNPDEKSNLSINEKAVETDPIGSRRLATKDSYQRTDRIAETKGFMQLNNAVYRSESFLFEESTKGLPTDNESSDYCLINILAAINIAVLLFEMASPIRDSDPENLSLPLFYGAKINKLILLGEWWRLVTPMCLHSGLLHVAFGCWVLLTFGPRVCRAYGQPTFFLIYVLGGICGNLTSFVHTPELTVCGTGPIFALIGAWLVYQNQNKEVIHKDVAESMFKKAVTAAALSFVLSSLGRIDNWTHLGAVVSGLLFGYFTCPTVELDNSASEDGGNEGIALVRRQANPCKSLAVFVVGIIIILTLFVVVYQMQFEILEPNS